METMIHHLIQPADTVPGDDASGAATTDERFTPPGNADGNITNRQTLLKQTAI